MKPPLDGMTKHPAGEEFMLPAFLGMVDWAYGSKVVKGDYAAYLAEGGPLSFLDWLVVFVWGEEV